MDIRDVIKKHEKQLMDLPNVNGVGIGEKEGKEVIQVLVTHKFPESALKPQEVVPKTLDAYATDVVEVGSITAQ